MEKRIGFAGLGLMGSRMARCLLDKGLPLSVWSRTPERCEPLAKAGARVARSPRDLAEHSEVVVACVADPAAVERVVFAEDGVLGAARPGFRYLETSTISPELSRRVAEALRARGADALEAPVTGSKLGAEKGTLLFMTGGRREVHEELMPVMMAMGSKAIYCGETGQASVVKLIGNTLISFMLEGLCEGILLARKAGVSIETLIEVVMASGYSSPYYAFKGGAIARRDFDTHFSIDLLVKDQTLMLAEAASQRLPLPGLAAIREVFQAARAQGYGQEDIGAVVKALERAAGD
ncbi:MAG TPA: NAD(P)-dependent oxidoreductase [Vicinamibacteria bacterium]|jgi:3-hydroxyisobutyrate dehydrogenase-like beta-hydroxyacid dehydrogenase|nr:NAD(P)-dependent oxidoreductase [Vicinamibacteria bacterium]